MDSEILKGDQSRFLDYNFASVQCQSINVTGNLVISSIASVSPIDEATITIPSGITYLLIQNTVPYNFLTFKLPFKPVYGQILTIISTVDILNVQFVNGEISTPAPTSVSGDKPLRFIFAGTWFGC